MTDEPIAHRKDGSPIFDNTATVVCVIVPSRYHFVDSVLVVKRGHEPGKGKWALPGGYQMKGETWQEAGVREVREETGVMISHRLTQLGPFVTDEYGNNLIIAKSSFELGRDRLWTQPPETMDHKYIKFEEMYNHEWAFPKHFMAIVKHFTKAP